jgi:hypothetical protein
VTRALLAALLFATTPVSPTQIAPQTPVVVFAEDFELSERPVLLTDYAAPAGPRYSADPAWLTSCNGLIASERHAPVDPTGGGCNGRWPDVQRLAGALGEPATNHALTAHTESDPGPGKVQFETVAPVALSRPGRFLTWSVDAAAQNCGASHAMLAVLLLDGRAAVADRTAPIDPCGGAVDGSHAGTYRGDRPVLFPGAQLGMRLVNLQGSGVGNDAAVDNIRVLDVTPQLEPAFRPAEVAVGATATLAYTVTNTADLGAKDGWSFFGRLPAGVTVAGQASTDCTAANVTAVPGATAVSAEASLAVGQVSCAVTVPVTASAAGTYTTCAADIAPMAGLNPPGCASVRFRS